MSTKTTFKRIALVAVAALGFGVLSVVPSSAAPTSVTMTVGVGTSSLAGGASDSKTAASFNLTAVLGAADSITVAIVTKSVPVGGSTDARFINLDSATATNTTQKLYQSSTAAKASTTAWPVNESATGGFVIGSASATNVNWNFGVQLESATAGRVAGTYVFTLIAQTFEAGTATAKETLAKDVTITIAAAAVVVPKAAVAAQATAYMQAGTSPTFTGVLGDSATSGSFTAGTVIGKIKVVNNSAVGVSAVDTITVSMTGNGSITDGSVAGTGRNLTFVNVADVTLSITADGNSGEGKITITTAAGASFVKTVTFFDTKPTKAVATVKKAYIKAGTGSVADVFSVVVTDVLGNAINAGGVTVTAAPTDTATTVGGAATCAWDSTAVAYMCAVVGLSATKFGPVAYTITATGTGVNLATKITTTATVTFADNVATKAVLAGPASAGPGASVEYTMTLTEKNGYPVADQTYGAGGLGGVLFAKSVVSGWGATVPFLTTESFTSVSGVITSKGIMALAGTATGTWTLAGDGLQTLTTDAIDKTIGKTTLTASTDVANAAADAATAAAEEATAAAQDATDAALGAAEAAEAAGALAQEAVDLVTELSAKVTELISALKAQITTLTNLVIKIQKKVKA
jgi:hypothetical protein